MSRVAPVVPEDTDLLCEGCGYTLKGLPPGGNCPECGKPTIESIGHHRSPPPWESACAGASAAAYRFVHTTGLVLFHPARFYRTITTRGPLGPARTFAAAHWAVSSLILGGASAAHVVWYDWSILAQPSIRQGLALWVSLALGCYIFIRVATRLAAGLSAWEAAYRGLRLPLPVVLRGMYYHAAHYLPVALLALATIAGYRWLLTSGLLGIETLTTYLYILSAEVVLCAAYLFQTYWISMRNMMYANR